MSSTDENYGHRIWLDGVELTEIVSGDVSAAVEIFSSAIANGGGWVDFPFQGGYYSIHVAPSSSVIARHIA